MHKLLRYYSQNRIKVWATILGIIFIILVIQVLNNIEKEKRQNSNEEEVGETTSDVVSYHNESEMIIGNGEIPEVYQEGFGSVIDEFYTYCINHQPEKAYELLAPDTKRVLYPTEKQFENLYYKEKFQGDKEYSFQAWTKSSSDIYIYQVKIFENMLATGKYEYMEDYVTIVPVADGYKLNINSYIGTRKINKKQGNELITVEISVADRYMEYEIYTLRIKNNTDQTILLDTRRETDTTYITDENRNQFEAFLYEKAEQDLILKPQESKTIQIKFNDSYQSDMNIMSMNFVDIVNYDDYTQNENIETYTLKIDI